MTRSILMYERPYHDETGRRFLLQYYLLIDEVIFGCNSLEIYGAKTLLFQGDTLLDQKAIRGLTPFGPKITSILNCLADGYGAYGFRYGLRLICGKYWTWGKSFAIMYKSIRRGANSMKCPYCGDQESKVVDSRHSDDGLSIRRRRECLSCQKRFTTYETVESLPIIVVKKDGSRQSFDRNKVLNGMVRACEKRPVPLASLEQAVSEIEQILQNSLEREVRSETIGELVMERLRRLDEVSYVRFASVYRQFKDVHSFMDELNKFLEEK